MLILNANVNRSQDKCFKLDHVFRVHVFTSDTKGLQYKGYKCLEYKEYMGHLNTLSTMQNSCLF